MPDGPALIFIGKVLKTADPQDPDHSRHAGRVLVEVYGLGNAVVLPWLRVLSPYAGKEMGLVLLPEVGDEVVVLRGNGDDPNGMFVLGSVHHAKTPHPAPDPDGHNDVKLLKTRAGSEVRIVDTAGAELILVQTPEGSVKLTLDHKNKILQVDSTGDVVIKATGNVNVEADTVNLKGTSKLVAEGGALEVKSSGQVTVQGSAISLKGMVTVE